MTASDFFISHASEDKPAVARPLASILDAAGFRVWFDEMTLSVGDSLRQSIERGIAEASFGIAILSPAFLAKKWTQDELSGIWARESAENKLLLPVWHQITHEDLAKRAPMLADRIAVNTARGLQHVAEELVRAAFPGRQLGFDRKQPTEHASRRYRQELLGLLENNASINDVRLFLSAHPELLRLPGAVIPASKVDARNLCDFVCLEYVGLSKGMEIALVKLGSLERSDRLLIELRQLIDNFEQVAEIPADNSHNTGHAYDMIRSPAISQIVHNCENLFSREPHLLEESLPRWAFSEKRDALSCLRERHWFMNLLVFAGRRNMEIAGERNQMHTQLPLSIRSYDWMVDDLS
jgi:hypothetical protein